MGRVHAATAIWSPPPFELRGREALDTFAPDGNPDVVSKMPEDSYAPFRLELASLLFFTGLALTVSRFGSRRGGC